MRAVPERLRLSKNWLMVAVPALVLLLAVGLSWRGGRSSLLLALLPLLLLAGLAAARRPGLTLTVWLLAALTLRFELGTGTQTTLNLAVLGAAGLFGLYLLRSFVTRRWAWRRTPADAPLLLLVLAALFSLLAGFLPWNAFAGRASLAAQLGGWAVFALSAATFWLAAQQLDETWLRRALTGFLALGGVYLLGRALGMGVLVRVLAPGADGSLWWVWLAALSGGLLLFARRLSAWTRGGLLLILLLDVWVGWQNRSWASGWLPVWVTLAALIWLRKPWLGFALTLAVAGGVWLLAPGLLTELLAADAYSVDTRRLAWQILVPAVWNTNALLGWGPSNYYFYTPVYPILGYYVSFNSHNQYVDLFAQVGLLGVGLFGWVVTALAVWALRLRRLVQTSFGQAYLAAALAGLAGMLVAGMLGDWLLPFVYNIGLRGMRASLLGWFFLGGLAVWSKQVHK